MRSDSFDLAEDYDARVGRLVTALMGAGVVADLGADLGLDFGAGRSTIVAKSLPIIQDIRFLPTFLTHMAETHARSGSDIALMLVPMSLTAGLSLLSAEELGIEGLAVLLALGDEDLDYLKLRYSSLLDNGGLQRLIEIADDWSTTSGMAARFAARLRAAAAQISVGEAFPIVDKLSDRFAEAQPEPWDFLSYVLRQAEDAPVSMIPGLEELIRQAVPDAARGGMPIALCSWALRNAMQLLQELPDEDGSLLADVLRWRLSRQLWEWGIEASQADDLESSTTWALGYVWSSWGTNPARPYTALEKLGEANNEAELLEAVREEPWLLTTPGIGGFSADIFIAVPTLIMLGGRVLEVAERLRGWQGKLTQPERNPIVHLASQVHTKRISLEDALADVDALEGLDVLQLAAVDHLVNDDRNLNPLYQEYLATLNYRAAQRVGHPLMKGYSAWSLAFTLMGRRSMGEVIGLFEEALSYGRQLRSPLLTGEALDSLGQSYSALFSKDEALHFYHEALVATRVLPGDFGRVETLLNMVDLLLRAHDLDAAARYLKVARAYGTDSGRTINAGRYWGLLARLAWLQGDPAQAESAWKEAKELGVVDPALQLRDLLVGQALEEGRFQDALDGLHHRFMEAQQRKDRLGALSACNLLLVTYFNIGAKEEYFDMLKPLEYLALEVGDRTYEPIVLQARARSWAMRDKPGVALLAYMGALRASKREGQLQNIRDLLSEMASCYLDMDRPGMASFFLRMSGRAGETPLNPAQTRSIRLTEARAWAQAARHMVVRGRQEEASELRAKAAAAWLDEAQAPGLSPMQRVGVLSNMSRLYKDMGERQQNAWVARRIVELLDEQRERLTVDVVHDRVIDQRSHLYGDAIEILVDAGDVTGAIEVAERIRARRLGSLLLRLESMPPAYREDYRQAWQNLEAAENRHLGAGLIEGHTTPQRYALYMLKKQEEEAAEKAALAGDGQEAEVNARRNPAEELADARRAYQTVVENIRQLNPDFEPRRVTAPPSLEEIRASLGGQRGAALVYLQVRSTRTVALIVTTDDVAAVDLPLVLDNITTFNLLFRLSTSRPEGFWREEVVGSEVAELMSGRFNSTHFAGTLASLSEPLTRLVWEKLHPELERLGVRHIVMLPDQFLSFLPLQSVSLKAPQEGEGTADREPHTVLDRYTVSHVPSARVLGLCARWLRERDGHREPVGDREDDTIHWAALVAPVAHSVLSPAILPSLGTLGKGRILWSPRADVRSTGELVDGARFFHVHVHGRFDSDLPQEAALELSPEPGRRIRLVDIPALWPYLRQNHLVVLAACESGEVEMEPLPDFVGLPMSFFLAGTPCVIASPWRLPEPVTTLILRRFYSGLAEGVAVPEALKRAQLAVRELSLAEIVRELEGLSAEAYAASESASPDLRSEYYAAGSQLRRLSDAYADEERLLQSLYDKTQGLNREEALEVVGATAREHPGRRGAEDRLHELTSDLLIDMIGQEWDAQTLHVRLHNLLQRPFASPYYWAGLQVMGATEG